MNKEQKMRAFRGGAAQCPLPLGPELSKENKAHCETRNPIKENSRAAESSPGQRGNGNNALVRARNL
ncbi:Hypothetical predicted protein [Marmota monax]|uniref:Uncharacterized protein n=1 Tax=Marmota monax TaxID=9995 RepID=A0A5E4BFN2_MARMO|nr:hypothetical protein GHT09_002319 [Marmota monax]VTJ67412.1 Hypothetical predicted protein [Marmota monax]